MGLCRSIGIQQTVGHVGKGLSCFICAARAVASAKYRAKQCSNHDCFPGGKGKKLQHHCQVGISVDKLHLQAHSTCAPHACRGTEADKPDIEHASYDKRSDDELAVGIPQTNVHANSEHNLDDRKQ